MMRILMRFLGFVALLAVCLLARSVYLASPLTEGHMLLPAGLGGLALLAVGRLAGWRWALAEMTLAAAVTLALTFFSPWPGGTGPANALDSGLTPVRLRIPAGLAGNAAVAKQSLRAVPGLQVSLFAAGLREPRMLAFSPAGDLYVSLPRAGQVLVLPDRDHDGVADRREVFAAGLDLPHGLAFAGHDLVVAEGGRLIRLPDQNHDLRADRVEVLSSDIPASGGHWTRSVIVAPDGGYFVSAGSSCNACLEQDPRRAAILYIPPKGGTAQIYARGLRNSVGLALHPDTGTLWASDNGRDRIGDDRPPEEINRIVQGGDYGWPFCYGKRILDPEFGIPERCRDTLPPEVEMQAHSAPLGIAFGRQLRFPKRYRDMLYVAFHGSWNRTVPTGYKLVGIPFKEGRPAGPPQDILGGWLRGRRAWGRPVAPAVGPDGALYLSDDRAGFIYRITMEGKGGNSAQMN